MKTWRERIAEARERGSFTREDIHDAFGDWTTCAVGEQHKAMPSVVIMFGESCHDGPIDQELTRLGGCDEGFARAVLSGDIDRAERLLDQIEDRVLQLKREKM